jgi:hypothetical protein
MEGFMLLIALLVIILVTASVVFITLTAVGGLVIRFDSLVAQITAEAEKNVLQHQIGRQYIGGRLIEGILLPHLGYKKPEKTPFERKVLADMANDPI